VNEAQMVKQAANSGSAISAVNLSGPQEAKIGKRKKKVVSQEEDRERMAKTRN
jgi:hypothetical protein